MDASRAARSATASVLPGAMLPGAMLPGAMVTGAMVTGIPFAAPRRNRRCVGRYRTRPPAALGPDAAAAERVWTAGLSPHRLDTTLAFMFETSRVLHPAEFALARPQMQAGFDSRWNGLRKHFHP